MEHLPIIVKGRGIVPRLGFIAPITNPFKVDKLTLNVIIRTPNNILKPYFVDPINNKETELTLSNWQSLFDDYQKRKGESTITESLATIVNTETTEGNIGETLSLLPSDEPTSELVLDNNIDSTLIDSTVATLVNIEPTEGTIGEVSSLLPSNEPTPELLPERINNHSKSSNRKRL